MEHFKTQEIVCRRTYEHRGERSLQLMDNRITNFIDHLREALKKPITVNDWVWGGINQYRGLRDSGSDVYSQYSQHTYGRAIDFTVKGMTSESVRQWIIANRELDWIKPISFIEDGVSWVHCDVRDISSSDLWLYDVHTKENLIYKRNTK